MPLCSIKRLDVTGKTVLVRVDLNVPMEMGRVSDMTRITRLAPTLEYLLNHNARVVVLSHFGRPKGAFNREMSLAPLVDALSASLGGREVKFAVDCIGNSAEQAVKTLKNGEVLLLENVRFHPGEEKNDPEFVKELASLGDIYVNDTFSCSHRAHGSIVGLAQLLPSAMGFLLADELENIERILTNPAAPMAAIVGGSKVSTKLGLLESLLNRVSLLVIGGAMANTFLYALGHQVGKSLYEPNLVDTAKTVLAQARKSGCEIILPQDLVIAQALAARQPCQIIDVTASVPADHMILDVGPATVAHIGSKLEQCKTLIWNGPLGAFETSPFDVGTLSLARIVAALTAKGKLISIAGGGDSVSAIGNAGLADSFSYISTAGGAFLEWLEGKPLPGIAALQVPTVCAAPQKALSI